MLAEFLDRIARMAQEAASGQVFEVESLRQVIVRKGDEFETFPLPPPLRTAVLDGIADVILAADTENGICNAPEIYVSQEGGVQVFVDRSDRHAIVSMPFQFTETYLAIAELQANKPRMSAAQLIRFLRFRVNAVGVDGLISKLRRVDFHRAAKGHQETGHGRESYGKSVEAEVQGVGEIPEEIEIEVSLYVNPGLQDLSRVTLKLGIHIDTNEEAFVLAPLADEIESAKRAAQASIVELISSRLPGVPVFCGMP